jgi:hypothetical protein
MGYKIGSKRGQKWVKNGVCWGGGGYPKKAKNRKQSGVQGGYRGGVHFGVQVPMIPGFLPPKNGVRGGGQGGGQGGSVRVSPYLFHLVV